MNVIFLTLGRIQEINSRGIYTDLMRKFRNEGHRIYIVTPNERQFGLETSLKEIDGVHILGVKTLNIQKTNFVEKGIGTILLESQFASAIKKHLSDVAFDLILYSTPPITFTKVVKHLKRKSPKAISYLLLKDIFPQNAVDLGFFSKNSLFYWFFRKKEVELYQNSDYIGCMSPANVEFVLKHNPFVSADRVEVAPNSVELIEDTSNIDKDEIRRRYHLPLDKTVFIYGGNLGKPQGIDYLIQCLDSNKERTDCYFLVVGSGTEYQKIAAWFEKTLPTNAKLIKSLPKVEYDQLVQASDVGLIFLDYHFSIPNYPSRLLSYLEYKMPIIAATDVNTDIGTLATQNEYGYCCESRNVDDFTRCINRYVDNPSSIRIMGEKGYQFLKENYLVNNTYDVIMNHV